MNRRRQLLDRRRHVPRVVAIERSWKHERRFFALVAAAVAALCLLLIALPAVADEPRALPSFKLIEKLVIDRFDTDDRLMTDLITREAVEGLFAEIERAGWKIHGRDEILERVPAASEFFVRQMLGSKKGIAFMRDIAGMPLGYDRVDRLSRMSLGHVYVKDMIKGPDGYQLIQYMTEAPGGIELGRMLRDAPGGRAFNKPTGRIYTADQLLGVLDESYRAEEKRRAQELVERDN